MIKKMAWIVISLTFLIITGCTKTEPYGIEFESEQLDFGTVNEGETRDLVYKFKNTGTENLEIKYVKPSCGCTTTGDWDKIIKPGEIGQIPITFDSTGFQDSLTRIVSVKTNVPDTLLPDGKLIQLLLKGVVVPQVEIIPPSINLGVITDEKTPLTGSFQLKNNLKTPMIIEEIFSPDKKTTYELTTIVPEQEYRIDFTINPPFEGEGQAVTSKDIIVKQKGDTRYELFLPFTYFYKYPVDISPKTISLGDIKDETVPLKGNYEITNNLKTPLVIEKITPPDEFTKIEILTVKEDNKYSINFTVNPPFIKDKDVRKDITIKTGDGKEYVVSFSYFLPPQVQVNPELVEVDLIKNSTEASERRINIKSNIDDPISVSDINLIATGMEYSLVELREGKFYQIALQFPLGFTFPENQKEFTLYFNINIGTKSTGYTIPIRAKK